MKRLNPGFHHPNQITVRIGSIGGTGIVREFVSHPGSPDTFLTTLSVCEVSPGKFMLNPCLQQKVACHVTEKQVA
nr:hypothetical protein [Rhizobium ruizarguesonis]